MTSTEVVMIRSALSSGVSIYVWIFGLTVAVQSFHMLEHVVQVIQKFVLNSTQAHGLVGQLDLEWVHFAFNTVYIGLFVYLLLGWLKYGGRLSDIRGMCLAVLLVGVVFQGYHEVEHSVKFAQFLETGVQGTPGILGSHFNGIMLHFTYNVLVFIPLLLVFFVTGMHRRFWPVGRPILATP